MCEEVLVFVSFVLQIFNMWRVCEWVFKFPGIPIIFLELISIF